MVERRNRTLLDIVHSMIVKANLPISFWWGALLTAAYILNRVPSKSVPFTLYELWTGDKPNLKFLRSWGSVAYVHTTSHLNGKLGLRGKKCIFIRYSKHSKGYVFLREHDDGSVMKIKSRDANFLDQEFPSKDEVCLVWARWESIKLPNWASGFWFYAFWEQWE